MRLARLDLTRYGKFTERSLDFGFREHNVPDLHVVYGLNEAGKSTALNAYLDLLFGIEERSRFNFQHSYATMQVGGALEFDGATFELKRVKQRAASLLDASGQPVSDALLGRPLGSIGREDYRAMFSLDDETLEAGGEAILQSKGEIGRLLFQATAGLTALSDTLARLDAEAEQIYRKRASKTELAELRHRLADLRARRDDDAMVGRYTELSAALKLAETAYADALSQKQQLEARRREIDRMLRAGRPARALRDIDLQLATLNGGVGVPPDARSRIEALDLAATQLETRRQALAEDGARLVAEIGRFEIDDRLVALSPRLVELSDAIGRQAKAEEDQPRREDELRERQGRIRALLTELDRADAPDAARLLLPAPLLGTLRELIETHGETRTALSEAERELSLARERRDGFASASKIGEGGPVPDPGLVTTLDVALGRAREADAPRRLRDAELRQAEERAAAEAALGRLAPWTGAASALDAMVVPDVERLAQLRLAAETLAEAAAGHERRRTELAERRDLAAREAMRLSGEAGAIDEQATQAARQVRDSAWALHLARLDADSARAFEARMRAHDMMTEKRLDHADQIAALRAAETTRAEADEALSRFDREAMELASAREALVAEIGAEWPRGLRQPDPALPLVRRIRAVEEWIRRREEALTHWRAAVATELEITRLTGETTRLAIQLADALRALGIAAQPGELTNLMTLADATLTARRGAIAEGQAAARNLQQAEAELIKRKTAFDRASAAMSGWQARWDAALSSTWFPTVNSLAAVRAILETLGELPVPLREAEELGHRIAAMEADRRAFEAQVATLAMAVGETLVPGNGLALARRLRERAQEAQQQASRRSQLEADRDEVAARVAALADEARRHEAERNDLFAILGVGSRAEALATIAASEQRKALEQARAENLAEIAELFPGRSPAEALAEADSFDRDAAQIELGDVEQRLADLETAARERFSEVSAARARRDAVGSDDRISRLETEKRTVLLEMEEKAQRYLKLRAGSLLATRALRAYRDRHRSSMLDRAPEAFRQITRGAYTGLATQPDGEREVLIGLGRDGASRNAAAMSKGTRFQLYLALRFAGYEEFARLRPSVPFIADDIMETFDEPRSEEVFRLLGRMARIGQTIYFTHHRHLCDMARAVVPGVKVHDL